MFIWARRLYIIERPAGTLRKPRCPVDNMDGIQSKKEASPPSSVRNSQEKKKVKAGLCREQRLP